MADEEKAETPQYLTAEQVQQMINGALTGQKKAHKAELDALRSEVAKSREPVAPPPEDEEKKTAVQMARDLKARLDAAEKREQSKDERIKKQRAESEFARAWGDKTLDPKHARAQLALLREEGRVKVDDDERVYIGDDPIDAWADAFAKEHGASFRPARAANGTGKGKDEGASGTVAANGPAPKLSREEAGAGLVNALFGGVPIKP